jgi:hypothetical protein
VAPVVTPVEAPVAVLVPVMWRMLLNIRQQRY